MLQLATQLLLSDFKKVLLSHLVQLVELRHARQLGLNLLHN